MAASDYALQPVVGFESQPQHVGQYREVLRDVVWTSDAANSTADATISPDDVGLVELVGAHFLADAGLAYDAGPDAVGMVTVTLEADGDLAISGLTAAGVALDLDSTDVAAARMIFVGR